MRAARARKIRAGIMSRCDPQLSCPVHPVCDETLLDFSRLRQIIEEFQTADIGLLSLAARSRDRTKPWESIRQDVKLLNESSAKFSS